MATNNAPKSASKSNASASDAAPAPADNSQPIIGRKITLKPLQKMPMTAVARLGGVIVKTESVVTPYGESARFIGEIRMKMSESGKWDDTVVTHSNAVFLPKAAEGLLISALGQHANDEKFAGVEFAIEVRKKADANSKTGYVWEVRSLRKVEETQDRILALLA